MPCELQKNNFITIFSIFWFRRREISAKEKIWQVIMESAYENHIYTANMQEIFRQNGVFRSDGEKGAEIWVRLICGSFVY